MIGFQICKRARKVDAATAARFRELPVANISDSMSRITAGGPRLRPMHGGGNLSGPAFTVKTRPGDNLMIHKALDLAEPGDVLVVDGGGDLTNALIGEMMVAHAQKRGVAGMVTDSGLRDVAEIAQLPMPIYIRQPIASLNLVVHHAVDVNVPIACAGVPVYPGDVIVGDADGVVCVPRHLAAEVAEEGWEMERKERFVTLKIKAGAPLFGTYPPDAKTSEEYKAWIARGAPDKL